MKDKYAGLFKPLRGEISKRLKEKDMTPDTVMQLCSQVLEQATEPLSHEAVSLSIEAATQPSAALEVRNNLLLGLQAQLLLEVVTQIKEHATTLRENNSDLVRALGNFIYEAGQTSQTQGERLGELPGTADSQ